MSNVLPMIPLAHPTPQLPMVPVQAVIYSNASLYVGDLDLSVTEGELLEIFRPVGNVLSIRVCRDVFRKISLGYAYVNYATPHEAAQALKILNFHTVKGKPMRIMFSKRDPSIRKSGYANIFIKNLDTSIDNKALYDTFANFGTILSCKVAVDSNHQSKGYGFVQFESVESANKAIEQLNGMLINDKQVFVGLFVRRQERNGPQKYTNVYVNNLSEKFTDEELKNIFGKHGHITSAVVMKDANGNSKGFGFVNFENPDDAANAVEKLNGVIMEDKIWYVGKAQKKSEREAELKMKYEEERKLRLEKLQGTNLYIKNLADEINDEKLKELFSRFGTITSCKVTLTSCGLSRGSGFVAFTTAEEANHAINEMNGKMVSEKPLYVALAQRKEERRAMLQVHFAKLRAPGAVNPVLSPTLPGYSTAPTRAAPPQLFFGQGSTGIISPQPAGYGFQQQLIPGMRPGVLPNFYNPYGHQRQGPPRQRMGPRRGGNPQNMQQQFFQHNGSQGLRHMCNAQNGIESSIDSQLIRGPATPLPLDVGGMPVLETTRLPPVTINTLASALASASPENQRLMLGNHLFPLVETIEQNNAAKVTGMLLEMDKTEVLHLIESPDALKTKVAEALEVLRMDRSPASSAANQLGSLSID